MRLDDEALAQLRGHLNGPLGDDLVRFMALLSFGQPVDDIAPEARQLATDLGWTASPEGPPVGNAYCISDSCREYLFWRDRGGKLPFDGAAPFLAPDLFAGKHVVEIGSGSGANLVSLRGVSAGLCGVEPVEIYAQIGRILYGREVEDVPQTRLGSAEDMPFDDNEVDLVLSVTAHQYFDIHPALAEIARVLKPGGELLIIGGSLRDMSRSHLPALRKGSASAWKTWLMTLVNTASYTLSGKRIMPSRSEFTTSRPIHPTKRAMVRWLKSAGYEMIRPPTDLGHETCFHARKL